MCVDHMKALESLGFSRDDCLEALRENESQVDEAAIWLTHNKVPTNPGQDSASLPSTRLQSKPLFNSIEVNLSPF